MILSVTIGGALTLVLKPSNELFTCTRDYVDVSFDVDGKEPLDVANEMKADTERVELEGHITLMALCCALVASGVTIKPKTLITIATATGKFAKMSKMLDELTSADQLRMLVQQMTDAQVTFGASRAREVGEGATV